MGSATDRLFGLSLCGLTGPSELCDDMSVEVESELGSEVSLALRFRFGEGASSVTVLFDTRDTSWAALEPAGECRASVSFFMSVRFSGEASVGSATGAPCLAGDSPDARVAIIRFDGRELSWLAPALVVGIERVSLLAEVPKERDGASARGLLCPAGDGVGTATTFADRECSLDLTAET